MFLWGNFFTNPDLKCQDSHQKLQTTLNPRKKTNSSLSKRHIFNEVEFFILRTCASMHVLEFISADEDLATWNWKWIASRIVAFLNSADVINDPGFCFCFSDPVCSCEQSARRNFPRSISCGRSAAFHTSETSPFSRHPLALTEKAADQAAVRLPSLKSPSSRLATYMKAFWPCASMKSGRSPACPPVRAHLTTRASSRCDYMSSEAKSGVTMTRSATSQIH